MPSRHSAQFYRVCDQPQYSGNSTSARMAETGEPEPSPAFANYTRVWQIREANTSFLVRVCVCVCTQTGVFGVEISQ